LTCCQLVLGGRGRQLVGGGYALVSTTVAAAIATHAAAVCFTLPRSVDAVPSRHVVRGPVLLPHIIRGRRMLPWRCIARLWSLACDAVRCRFPAEIVAAAGGPTRNQIDTEIVRVRTLHSCSLAGHNSLLRTCECTGTCVTP
jgi:hypothetical protein